MRPSGLALSEVRRLDSHIDSRFGQILLADTWQGTVDWRWGKGESQASKKSQVKKVEDGRRRRI